MGSKITDNTDLGRRAKPLRNRLKAVIRRIETNPPEGVRPGAHGGKGFVSPVGYIANRLNHFADKQASLAKANGKPYDQWPWYWNNTESCAGFVRIFLGGGYGRHKQLDVLEKFLPEIEAQFPRHPVTKPGETYVATEEAIREQLAPPVVHVPIQPVDEDPEIAAIRSISVTLETLADNETRKRVLVWAADKFGVTL